jgi:transposase
MTDPRKLPRRRHSRELKARVLAECSLPGASVAGVALAHGINANVVHKWRRQAAGGTEATPGPSFVPLALPAPAIAADIRVELQHGATRMAVTWPAAAAAECAVWMRELLK